MGAPAAVPVLLLASVVLAAIAGEEWKGGKVRERVDTVPEIIRRVFIRYDENRYSVAVLCWKHARCAALEVLIRVYIECF